MLISVTFLFTTNLPQFFSMANTVFFFDKSF